MVAQAHLTAVITILFTALAFVAVCLRLFARGFITKAMGLDDYLIVVAWLLSCAFTVCIVLAMRHAFGEYLIEIDMKNLQAFLLGLWLSSLLYPASQGFIKLSICWFYTRLGHELLKRVSYYMIGLVVAQTIAFVLSAALHCPPSKWAHDPLYLLSCSASIKAFTLASGALSILTDVLTYTLPIPVILKLHMPSNQKAYIIIILGLGVVACASSVVRLVYGADLMKFPPDAVSIAGTFYWTSIEMNLAILAASIPSFKAIASRLFPWLIGEYPSKELQRPLRSGNTDDSERLRPFRRQRQSVAMSVLYTQNSDIGSPVDPTHSEERIPMSDGAIITQVVFEMSDKPHRGSENVQQNI